MKKFITLIGMTLICLSASAQEQEEYDKNTVFIWETDTTYIRSDYVDKTSFKPEMIHVEFKANKGIGSLSVENRSDMPFDMDWDYINIKLNDSREHYETEKRVNYTQSKQTESVPKNGKVYQWVRNCFSGQFYDMKEIKKQLKQGDVPVALTINFAIIYDGEETMIEVRKTGVCRKK